MDHCNSFRPCATSQVNAGKLTPEEIRRLFPNATPSLLRANGITCDTSIELPVKDPEMIATMRESLAKGIRPNTDVAKLNKTERAYLRFLESLQPDWLGVQCITLKVGHDLRYTPDFWAVDPQGLRAIDTKGPHVWEDSLIKMRICARVFPWIRFVLAKRDGLNWSHKELKP